MTEVANIDNAIAKISREHKLISDYVGKFTKAKTKKTPKFFESLNEFVNFLQKDLRRHFELEEVAFFPAAIQGDNDYNTTLLVLALQKDHGIMETHLDHILSVMKDPKKTSDEEVAEIGKFFHYLKIHAKREIMELFPLIDQNVKCKSLLMKFLGEKRALL